MKKLLRKLTPEPLILAYHFCVAHLANLLYGHPSKKMVIIGVTGTKGKTTTSALIAHLLQSAGHTVGLTSSVQFKIADRVWINDTKMGMLGRFKLQRLLKEMKDKGVTHAIIETSSEGIKQFRNRGIRYDAVVYTNLSPEHIESHGSYDAYKKTKFGFIERVALSKPKKIKGKILKKALIVSTDNEDLKKLMRLPFDKRWVIDAGVPTTVNLRELPNTRVFKPTDMETTSEGITFQLGSTTVELPMLGVFNAYNASLALAVGEWLEIPLIKLATSLKSVPGTPGRMEKIDEGQSFTVIVDYAHEPKSIEAAYKAVREMADTNANAGDAAKPRVICVTGSAGGGRDKARRPVLGELAAKYGDFVIVTNEDPYDEDPMEIIEQVAAGVEKGGKLLNNTFWKIADRREAVEKALSLASGKDVVILTGKGAEQVIMGKDGTRHPWDERTVVREVLRKVRQ